jgi:hypothetical protein
LAGAFGSFLDHPIQRIPKRIQDRAWEFQIFPFLTHVRRSHFIFKLIDSRASESFYFQTDWLMSLRVRNHFDSLFFYFSRVKKSLSSFFDFY